MMFGDCGTHPQASNKVQWCRCTCKVVLAGMKATGRHTWTHPDMGRMLVMPVDRDRLVPVIAGAALAPRLPQAGVRPIYPTTRAPATDQGHRTRTCSERCQGLWLAGAPWPRPELRAGLPTVGTSGKLATWWLHEPKRNPRCCGFASNKSLPDLVGRVGLEPTTKGL